MKSISAVAVAAAVLCCVAPVRAAETPPYRVVARYTPGGEGGWDYLTVDATGRRLFVTRGTHVQVLGLADGRLVGEIQDTPGVHGVALAPDLGRGFTSNGRDSSVTIFDLRTLAPLGRVHLHASHPDAILYEPVSHRVLTMNAGSDDATVIDAASGAVVGNLALGGRPEFAVHDGHGRVFVNLEDSSAVVGIDPVRMAVVSRWPLAPGEEPSGLAIDREHRRLFSVCGNRKMIVLDADRGKVLADLPIGSRVDGAAYDPGTATAFASNGEGTLTVVHEDGRDRFRVVGNIETQRGARTLAVDLETHRVYEATASYGPAPAPSADNPRPRPPMVPGSFVVLVIDR